ncbi:hypothetical protein [Paenibacillus sp. V4I7]|uniref:hypothetical protein n=1 Tax=Paenibacillus sp. V4I7 TaxID=3042307 RepID=UPI00277D76C3|nr:hypothetical protein [Paenibacillus sp. V4I7]MDQ0899050.1 hypothetical protein [Paenibacillus sp. V4I7]
MTLRKSIYILIAIILIGFGCLLYKIQSVVPSTMKFSDFGLGAETLYFYKGGTYYKNQTLIQKYFDLNKIKDVRRISFEKTKSAAKIISFAYNSDKGRDLFIDDKGSVYFVVSKSEIRNKSRLHWLWWKLDVSNKYNSIYYFSDPDPAIVELMNQITNEIGYRDGL